MITEVALTYLNTPFVHQGRAPGYGLDCVGVYVCAAAECGRKLDDFTCYGREADSVELLRRLNKDFDLVPKDQKQKDDLLLFWIVRPSLPQHVGVYDGSGSVIHAYSRRHNGRVQHEPFEGRWEKHLHSVHRLKAA